ncbi:MAG: peptide chain release factor-like protein [Gammaproteobacteria bacterium]|nr:peptide chain release factor-like protein [Gammaproteobacteria bacterium]
MITLNKWKQLNNQMQQLNIADSDLVEKFIIGSGHGGQKLQKTASCVYLKHIPTGLEIKCQKSRMREENRFHARRRLIEKIEEQLFEKKSQHQQEAEKIRRQKRRRSRRSKLKMLADKKQHAGVKKLRKTPSGED